MSSYDDDDEYLHITRIHTFKCLNAHVTFQRDTAKFYAYKLLHKCLFFFLSILHFTDFNAYTQYNTAIYISFVAGSFCNAIKMVSKLILLLVFF